MKKLLFLFLLQIPTLCLGVSDEFNERVKVPIENFLNQNSGAEQKKNINELLKVTFNQNMTEQEQELVKMGYSLIDVQFLRFSCFLKEFMSYSIAIGSVLSRGISADCEWIFFGLNKGMPALLRIDCRPAVLPLLAKEHKTNEPFIKLFLYKAKNAEDSEPYVAMELFKKCSAFFHKSSAKTLLSEDLNEIEGKTKEEINIIKNLCKEGFDNKEADFLVSCLTYHERDIEEDRPFVMGFLPKIRNKYSRARLDYHINLPTPESIDLLKAFIDKAKNDPNTRPGKAMAVFNEKN